MLKNRADIIFIIASIIIMSVRICSTNKEGALIFDDSYMQLRYADHIVQGGGYSWNYGNPSYGCTSILYIFYIIILRSILGFFHQFDDVTILQFCAILMYFFYTTFTYRIKTIILNNNYLYSIILFFLSLSPLLFYNTYNAVETMASLAFLTGMSYYATLVLVEKTISKSLFIKLCIFSILAFSIRHDNGIYALLMPSITFVVLKNKKYLIQFLSIFFSFLILDLIIKNLYFGDPLPLTFYIKQGNYYKGYMSYHLWSPYLYLASYIRNFVWLPALIMLLYFNGKALRSALVFFIPLILTFIYYFTVTQIMGNDARFYVPSTGILLTGLMFLTDDTISLNENPFKNNMKIALSLAILFAPYVLEIFHYKVYFPYREKLSLQESKEFRKYINYSSHLQCKQYAWQPLVLKMDTLVSFMEDEGVLAATEYGYLGYKHPKMAIMDLAGLHNKEIAKHGFSDKQLERYKPDLIWMPHFYYTGLYFSVMYSEYFRDNYIFYPYLYNYGVAVHRNSRFKTKLIQEIEKQQ